MKESYQRPWRAMALAGLMAGCVGSGEPGRRPKMALFVGIDVSGSFRSGKTGHFNDSLEFLAHYIYGHLNGLGDLHPIKALFVGAIGGQFEDEAKSFHPIQDFQGKSIEQIVADLKSWFSEKDQLSDFSMFFKQVAHIAEKRNLALSPITVILLSDGIPALPGPDGEAEIGRYDNIDLAPLEYLSRKVTVRLLYASPTTASKWEAEVSRQRVRMWTVDDEVMVGWKSQLAPGAALEQQGKLWNWISENVDYRVRPIKFRISTSRKK